MFYLLLHKRALSQLSSRIPLLEFHRCRMQHLRVKILTRVKSSKDFISSQNAFNQSKERDLKYRNAYMFHQNLSDIDGFTVDQILRRRRNGEKY